MYLQPFDYSTAIYDNLGTFISLSITNVEVLFIMTRNKRTQFLENPDIKKRENSLYATENLTTSFYAMKKVEVPSMPST